MKSILLSIVPYVQALLNVYDFIVFLFYHNNSHVLALR